MYFRPDCHPVMIASPRALEARITAARRAHGWDQSTAPEVASGNAYITQRPMGPGVLAFAPTVATRAALPRYPSGTVVMASSTKPAAVT